MVGDIGPSDDDDYLIVEREDGTYLVDAQIPFYDFMARFEKADNISQEDMQEFNTLAGFIIHHLQSIPRTGDCFDWESFKFEIIDMDGNRIDKVLVTWNKADEEEEKNQE